MVWKKKKRSIFPNLSDSTLSGVGMRLKTGITGDLMNDNDPQTAEFTIRMIQESKCQAESNS